MLFTDVPLRARRALMLFKDVPLKTRRALMLFTDVPLRTRRALSWYKVYGNSALLALSIRYIIYSVHQTLYQWQSFLRITYHSHFILDTHISHIFTQTIKMSFLPCSTISIPYDTPPALDTRYLPYYRCTWWYSLQYLKGYDKKIGSIKLTMLKNSNAQSGIWDVSQQNGMGILQKS